MSKSNTFENELLLHIFQNADIADIGDAAGLQNSVAAGSLYLALHTADPGEAGTQSTSEIAYTGYARQAVARSAGGFTVSANVVTLAANVDFPEMTAGAGGTVTHFSVGKAASGAGVILYKGTATPNILIQTGTIPRLKAATSITEDETVGTFTATHKFVAADEAEFMAAVAKLNIHESNNGSFASRVDDLSTLTVTYTIVAELTP